MRLFFVVLFLTLKVLPALSQDAKMNNETDSLFANGKEKVNQCTPWHHAKCVWITTKEVYADGRDGKSTRHWWRMSYIGQACSDTHGKTFGKIFEGLWAVPHYIGVALANGAGLVVYVFTGSKEDKMKRKKKRRERRENKKKNKD